MTRVGSAFLFLIGAAMVVFVAAPHAQGPAVPPEISTVLTELGGFTADDIALLQSGQVIARSETAPDLLEASVVAAVRIGSAKQRTVDYYRTLISYIDGQVTTAYGVFSRPPLDSDLRTLTLERGDLADLQACVPGDCAIRIRSAAPGAPPPAIDWSAADANLRANAWFRHELAAYAASYVSKGNSALVATDDQARPVNLVQHWQQIADRSPIVGRLSPRLLRYATDAPVAPAAGITEELYFDHQHYTGLKPIIGMTQMVTEVDPAHAERTVLLQKQVYASHYLYGALAVALLLQQGTPERPVTYVLYANRARGDLLKAGQTQPQQTANRGGISGAIGSLRSGISSISGSVQRRMGEQMIRSSAERLLSSMKEALENR